MKEKKKYAFNIMDRDHPEFKRLFHTCTCDNYFRELRSEGVGAEEHETEVVSPEEESKLKNTKPKWFLLKKKASCGRPVFSQRRHHKDC